MTADEAQLLRIYVNESDRWDGRPLYEALVRAAKEHGLAGATAVRAIEGFGTRGRVHTVRVLHLSADVPIVVEIIDRPERVAAFLPVVEQMVGEGMMTIQTVRSVRLSGAAAEAPADTDELQLESPDFTPQEPAVQAGIPWNARAEAILESARASAAGARRVFIDSVDLLLAMLCESKGVASAALPRLGIDCAALECSLRDEVSRDEPTGEYLEQVEEKSTSVCKWLGHREVGTEHLVLALCQIRPSAATDILMRLGVQPREICQEVLAIMGRQDDWQRWLADHPDM